MDWLRENVRDLVPVAKETAATQAWTGTRDGVKVFLKLYPPDRADWAAIETEISRQRLHPAIVPLLDSIAVEDGQILIYEFVEGESLTSSEARKQLRRLSMPSRERLVLDVTNALSAVVDAGFTVVDWYFGNMIYDFAVDRVWLFDWELCRPGDGFILEMEENYGSSTFMAPEEFVKGSTIDQQTLVFNVARFTMLILPELPNSVASILAKATHPNRRKRHQSFRMLADELNQTLAWRTSPLTPHTLQRAPFTN